MKLFEKYCVKDDFKEYNLQNMLQNLGVEQNIINEIIIRSSISTFFREFIKELEFLDEDKNPINLALKFLLLADRMKLISCNKEVLSQLTGLTERMIDERRRANKLPYIQLSGGHSEYGGRKIIVYDPLEVAKAIYKDKVKVEVEQQCS